jgi:phosphatidylglycerophosphatase A
MIQRPLRLITTFGLGHRRPASGTWGSLPPVVIAGGLLALDCGPGAQPWIYYPVLSAILVIFSAACIIDGDAAEARFGEKDPSEVVADETAGQCIPLLSILPSSVGTPLHAAMLVALAFVAVRILDIIKPPPAKGWQRIPGGWGILIDDLVAGVYAGVVMVAVVKVVQGLSYMQAAAEC